MFRDSASYTPAYSEQNTITSLSLTDFTSAFKAYGDEMARRILAQGITLVPQDSANVISTAQGVAFHSDMQSLGNSVHCFPCVTTGQTTVKAVVLDKAGLIGLVSVCKFLYHTPGFKAGSAEAIQAALTTKPTGKPDPTTLATIKVVTKTTQTWSSNRTQAKKAYDILANRTWLAALLGATDYGDLVAKLANEKPTTT